MTAQDINKNYHSNPCDETFQAKIQYAQNAINNGKAVVGIDNYKGRELQSISFPEEKSAYHLPLNLLKL